MFGKWMSLLLLLVAVTADGKEPVEKSLLPSIRVSSDGKGFERSDNGQPFHPWGFNYDHDATGRLLEDYWHEEWSTVEADLREMKQLGANVVRIHLQVGKFLKGPAEAHEAELAQLLKLVEAAEQVGLYLDVTGLGCYHKQDVPAWYDALDEQQRWLAQAFFWKAIAAKVGHSSAIFCYDLMNEPISPAGKPSKDWLGPAFGGKHFVQRISLDAKDRPRVEVARAWIKQLKRAIREVDEQHLITVGLVDWSLDRPGLTSGFVPSQVAQELDFVCVHLYPETGKQAEALQTMQGFAVGKPVVLEETFPLKCSSQELIAFLQSDKNCASGTISFYWGKDLPELKTSDQFSDKILLQWLEQFSVFVKERTN